MNYPQTKDQAKAYDDEGITWGASKNVGKVIVHYLNDLGAKHEIPQTKEGIVAYVNDYHRAMILRNDFMPKDIPFHIIYPPFFAAVMNNFVEVPDYQPWTVKNQLKAFKKWITKGGQVDKLYAKYYKEYPDRAPRQIETTPTNLQDWSDDVIKDQYKKICLIYSGPMPTPEIIGMKAYCKRIETEHEKRFN